MTIYQFSQSVIKAMAFTAVMLTAMQIAFAQPGGLPFENGLQPPPPGPNGPPAEVKQKMARELGLTADQQSKIDAIHQSFFESHRPQREAHQAKMDELHKLRQQGASEETLKARHQAMAADFQTMHTDHQKLDSQIKAVLTPDQAKKFDALREQHKPRFGPPPHAGPKP